MDNAQRCVFYGSYMIDKQAGRDTKRYERQGCEECQGMYRTCEYFKTLEDVLENERENKTR
jgi:hypothetical protein